MSDDDEKTDPSHNVPLWIENAVKRAMRDALEAIDKGCAAREERMLESEKRIISALDKLGMARLELNQKANEAGLRGVRDDVEALRADVEELKAWRRDTERCPPPSEHVGGE